MLSKTQMAGFIAGNILFLLLASLFIGGSLALLFVDRYPPAEELVYTSCTFQRYEQFSRGKHLDHYVYVQEYGKPLKIDDIAIRAVDRGALEDLKAGDIIVVSKDEDLHLYSLSRGGKSILSYEDFLAKHEGNALVGAVLAGLFSLLPIGLFVANLIHFKKTGRPLPMRIVRVRGIPVRLRGKL